MSECDEGPKRRVSRGRKRASCNDKSEAQGRQLKSEKRTLRSSDRSKDEEWFCNSFQSKEVEDNFLTSNVESFQAKEFTASTPMGKRRRRYSAMNDSMNKSDSLLADLDIDALTSQVLTQRNKSESGDGVKDVNKCGTKIILENDEFMDLPKDSKDVKCTDISLLNDSSVLSSPTESQYFVSKFGNYKPTQQCARKEVIVDNSSNITSCRNDNLGLSFSTQGDTRCTQTVVILEESLHDNSNGEKLASHHSDMKSQISQSRNVASIDGTRDFSQDSLPDTAGPVVDITQLKENEGFKYQCTPYRLKSQDLYTHTINGTQTQTQGELIAGTQYKSYFYDSIHSQSQLTSHDKHCETSQIPSSTMYNMTGVLVDTQKYELEGNTSGCDLFEDSLSDDTSQTNKYGPYGEVYAGKALKSEGDVTSHTQSLSCDDSSGKSQSRRQSLDDDLDSMMQESQNLREKTRKSKKSTVLMTNKSCENKNMAENIKVAKIVGSKRNTTSKVDIKRTNVLCKDKSDNGQNASKLSSVVDNTASMVETSLGAIRVGSGTLQEKSELTSLMDSSMKTELGTNVLNAPEAAGSLQEKIKKRLQDNVGRRTSLGPGVLMDKLREQVLERVELEAAIMKQQTFKDIGPFYGLPTKVKHLFENYRGIKTLYDWQDECLKLTAIQQRTNLIYSLPTSGGKTLVAEILILREILCHKRDALLIVPFVSIVQEKVRNMSQFAVDLDFYVEEYAGSKGRFPPIKRRNNRSLFIATIEKAQSIVNSLIETDRMDSLGLVVVDELHMLGEGGSRGSTLESTLMKILHASSPTHIIGMSATLNNIEDLRKFLNAEIYSNDFRPVTLTEYVKLSDSIYKVDSKALCPDDQFVHDRIVCFQYPPDMNKVDPDHLLGLVLEVIPDNSCLVFCPTKKNCENVALMMCKLMSKYKRELSEVKISQRKQLLKELYNDSDGKMCPVLQYTLYYGVGYHHSGLTSDERKLIEDAYSSGTLCLLTCTSTLAAGVNLPAKRVILRSPYIGMSFISRSQYKQMVGRAGRAGIDDSGESILICKSSDREKVTSLLQGPIENCHSSILYDNGKGLRTLLLSTIGLKITSTTEDVFNFVGRSLAKIQESVLQADVIEMCKNALQKLIDIGLVVQVKSPSEDPKKSICYNLEVTRLGKATFKGPIDSDYAVILYEDLKKAEEPLVIMTHLHLLYLVTPYDVVKDISPSWFIYFNQISHLSSSELKVASLIGVPESYIAKRASQQKSKQKVDEFVVSRFYLTLMLYDLWREKSVWEVAEKYQQTRGFVQNLLSSAASFATCVTHFCAELEEFWAYQDLMGNFVKRLSYCVNSELLPLMEIPGVKLGRARLMFAAGYQSLSAVASSNSSDLVKNVQFMPGKIAKQIIASAKLLLNEKAEAMMEEVEALVRVPDDQKGTRLMVKDSTPAPVTPVIPQS